MNSAEPTEHATATPAAKWRFSDTDLAHVLRDTYGVFDRRTLGMSRLFIGFYLIMDLFRRTADWNAMYSTKGVLPNDVNLWRPQASTAWTLLNAFSTSGELAALWVVIFLTYVCYFIGYKTRVAQVMSLIFVTSLNGRVLLIENGGYVVQNLLLLWTMFLPLGDRFSLDTMLRSMKGTRETTADALNDRTNLDEPERPTRHHTIMGLVLVVQLSAIYYFNVIHKTGPAWKNGTAVHYVLYVDRMCTPLIAALRDYVPNWMIIFFTKSTLMFEATIPIVLLSPLAKRWARLAAIGMINTLHIAFGTTFVLGPFAWAACCFSTLLFQTEDWDAANLTMRRAHRARTVIYDPRSAAAFWLCRVAKRCDNFELLEFQADPNAKVPLTVVRPSGERLTGGFAVSDIFAAFPLGPIVAPLWRLPGLRNLGDAMVEPGWARFFGLRAPNGASVLPEPSSSMARGRRGFVRVLREMLVLLMFASAINQALVELWVTRNFGIKQVEPLKTLAHKLRFLQGWFMFSPNPVMDDGHLIVDAITVDGRHIDPFTGKEPNFELLSAKSLRLNQIWSDYFNRIHTGSNTAYRDAMKAYLNRLPERTGNPNDAIVSADVYWITDMNPKWNDTKSYDYQQKKLFSYENKAVTGRADAAPAAGGEDRRSSPSGLKLDASRVQGLRESLQKSGDDAPKEEAK